MIIQGKNTLDLDAAEWLHETGAAYSIYASAYTMTNEDLRGEVQASHGANKILTIAGSGDQALFYTLGGAKLIDTFDMTICAGVIQEIKFAAIKMGIPYQDYITLLQQLHCSYSQDITQIKYMPEIIERIDPQAAYFIRGMKNHPIFSTGSLPRKDSPEIVSFAEYAQLQTMQSPAPKFIWSNARNISEHLDTKYDVINLSNIFDWGTTFLTPTLGSLINCLEPKGKIIIDGHDRDTETALNKFGKVLKLQKPNIMVFQRTR